MLGDVGRYAFLDHEMRNFFSAQFDPTKDLQNLEGKVIIVTGGKWVQNLMEIFHMSFLLILTVVEVLVMLP